MKDKICLLLVLIVLFSTLLYGCEQPSYTGTASSTSTPEKVFSAVYPAWDFPGAVDHATTIVYGEITNIQPAYEHINPSTGPGVEESSTIFTPIEISPIQLLKGSDTSESSILYLRMGGEFEGVRYVSADDDTTLQVGQKVLLFLNEFNCDIGPEWVMVEENGQVQYRDDDSQELANIPTENYLQMIREQISSDAE